MDKIYELTDAEYLTFFNKKKNDIIFIIQVLMSNITILINENINILNQFINQNMSEQNSLKKCFQTDFEKIKRKLKIAQSFDQSTVVDKFYLIIRQNRKIITNLHNPKKIDETISIQKIFNFLTFDDNKNLKKMYTGMYWLLNKYGNVNNPFNVFVKNILNGDDRTRINIIINAIKINYNDISTIIKNSYKNIENVIKIDDLSYTNDTKEFCENIIIQSTNDMGYKHMYFIIQIIKKMLLSYDAVYDDKYEYILFNIIVNELNNELINILSIDTNNTLENNDINAIVDDIDTNILKKYNIILYDNLIKKNMFSNSTIDIQFIQNTLYNFCTEINIYDIYKIYIDFYIDVLLKLTLKCKGYLNDFLQLNIPLIRCFNKNLYNLLIVSDRYFDAKLYI